jgi:M6 family metalloprotease-like protein
VSDSALRFCYRSVGGGLFVILLACIPLDLPAQQVDSSGAPAKSADSETTLISSTQSYNRQLRALLPAANTGKKPPVPQSPANSAALIDILTKRQKLVEQLVHFGLGAANSVRITPEERQQMTAAVPEASSLIEDDVEITGQAQQLVADDFAHHTSQVFWKIATNNSTYRLFFGTQPVPTELRPGLPLKVSGLLSGHSIAVNSAFIARPGESKSGAANATSMKIVPDSTTAPACSTTGTQNIAVLMVTTPANPSFPSGWDESFLQNHFFGTSGLGLNTYWQQASYGQTNAAGQVYGPFALSQNYTCGVDDEQLMSDAVAAASSTVNFSQYDRIALVFPVQSCTYGGLGSIGCGTGLIANQAVSEAWFPIFSYQLTSEFISLTGHEFGHNLGLNHGNTDDYGAIPLGPLDQSGIDTEYGDNYTVMGDDYNVSGEYVGQHKATLLGWLPYGAYGEISASGNYSVSPLENPGGVKTLRIIRNPNTGASLWLEYRQPLGIADPTFEYYSSSQSNVFAGASIRYQDPNLDKLHTYLLDYNPVEIPNYFDLAALTPGQTWSDPYSLLTLTAQVANTAGMAFTVSYDQPCAALSFSTATYAATGGTGTVQVSAPASCSWTASTSDPWISINSGASGSGNGTVSFTVGAASQSAQRTGYITVQRQPVPVLQAGTGPVLVPPGSSTAVTGTNANFSFNVTDANGPSDISTIQFNFSDLANSGCNVLTYGQQDLGGFWLLSDTGDQWLPFSNGSVSNSQCTLYADSTETISGNTIIVKLHIQFASSVGGNHIGEVYAYVNSGTSYGPFSVGAWQVPYAGPVAAMSNQFMNFGTLMLGNSSAQTAVLTNSGLSPLSIGAVSFTGINPTQFSQTSTCPASLAAGASCNFSVVFKPTTSGAQTAVMNIADSANGSPQLIFVQGLGQNPLQASPSSIAFENQILNTSSPVQNVTLTDIGSTALAISSISITGTNAGSFSQTNNCPSQLSAGSNCTLAIKFDPSSSGSASAEVSLTYTPKGAASFSVSIPLLGSGVTSVSAPIFSLVAGTYESAQSVAISDETAGDTVYYTTNGTAPTSSSTKYTGPIAISKTTTLKAIAIVSGSSPSSVTAATYDIVNPVAAQTNLTVTPSSAAQGSVFTMQAAVTSNGVPVPWGTVTFYDGSAILGSAVLNKSTGVATLKTASLLPGTNKISAKFNQDNLDLVSTSNQVAASVTGTFPTVATLTSAGTQGNYVLTTDLTSFGAGLPGGTVTFNDTSTQTVLGTAAPSGFQTLFTGTATAPQSSGTQDIALGDVDGDGHLDMVVASYNGGSNWISVSLGNGDGTFRTAVPISTLPGDNNGGPAVVLADVNGDGKLDVLAASWAGYGLDVFLGNGDGTFGPEAHYALDSSYANSIAVGDFNGDGKLDAVTSDPFGATISILLGNGDGTFQTEHPFPTDTTPEAVTVADLNKDGRLDIAVTNTTGTVSILLGNGDGTFQVLPLIPVSSSGHYQGPKAITSADFNGDGKLDLAVSIWDSESVGILLGNGDGTFQPAQLHSTPGITPTGVQVADINRDGFPDLAVCSYNGSATTVLLNIGNGAFQVNAYAVDNGSGSIALGDLNGDGLTDLVTVSATKNSASPRLALTSFSATITSVTLPGFETDKVSATYSGDTKFGSSTSNVLTLPSNSAQTATPTFKPLPGSYTGTQSVTIADSTTGAAIYYTTNGTTPTTSSTKYTGAIAVSSTETIKAIATATGDAQSAVATGAYTITASIGAVSVTPNSGTGLTQSFTAVYTDSSGASSLTYVKILFNNSLTGVSACYATYDPPTNAMYLENNADTSAIGPLTPGSTSSLSNSQCTLSGTGSSVSVSGNNISVTFALSFTNSFDGPRNIYMEAGNSSVSSGWANKGTWTPVASTAGVVSVTPSSGTGLTQAFTAKYSDPAGAADLDYVKILFNGSVNGVNGCYVTYSPASNALYLENNADSSELGPITPGSSSTLSNSQCTLSGTGSSATKSGNTLSVTYNLTFSTTFESAQKLYLYAISNGGGNSGWVQEGTWTP